MRGDQTAVPGKGSVTDDKSGLGWGSQSDTGQRANGLGLRFGNSMVTSKPLQQSGNKGPHL